MTSDHCPTDCRRLALICTLVAILVVILAGCGVPGPNGPSDTYGLDFTLPADAGTSGAIVFLVDGLHAAMFQEMLEAGELPSIKKYFADRGLYAPRAVANIPSVTLANLTSIVTGQFAGTHGITGVNWFDRNRLIWRNYETIAQKNTLDGDYTAPTIYEMFPGRTTFSVFYQPHRGATKFIENWTSAGPPFFFRWYEFVDRLTLSRLDIVADIARRRSSFPAVTVLYMLSPDFRAYNHGFSSKQYRQSLLHSDRQIGRVCADLQRAGLLDKLHLAIVSDHGHLDVTRHFPMERFLRNEIGLELPTKRLWESTPFEKRLRYYQKFPAAMYGSGDRYVAISLRKPRDLPGGQTGYHPWTVRPASADMAAYPVPVRRPWMDRLFSAKPTPQPAPRKDLLTALIEQEAVDAVAYRIAPGRVRVRRKNGEVEFRQHEAKISYHLISGDDPFGWRGQIPQAALAGAPMTGRQWLEATLDTAYPDLPAQILAYFHSQYAGDIAVFASAGWDFFNTHRAGHGGLTPQDMQVPMLLAGPGVPTGRIDFARTVDLVPTLLGLLGREIPPGLDGQDLIKHTKENP